MSNCQELNIPSPPELPDPSITLPSPANRAAFTTLTGESDVISCISRAQNKEKYHLKTNVPDLNM